MVSETSQIKKNWVIKVNINNHKHQRIRVTAAVTSRQLCGNSFFICLTLKTHQLIGFGTLLSATSETLDSDIFNVCFSHCTYDFQRVTSSLIIEGNHFLSCQSLQGSAQHLTFISPLHCCSSGAVRRTRSS